MTMASLKVTIRVAWWVRWYIYGVALCARITSVKPDMDKITSKVMKGVRIK